ncbi:hypothetical protein [Hyphomonas sp.]|uniref:hypothetical protein n=1 Tax=Hyphomonas sp. TaxID=87 RepID=UPI003298D731
MDDRPELAHRAGCGHREQRRHQHDRQGCARQKEMRQPGAPGRSGRAVCQRGLVEQVQRRLDLLKSGGIGRIRLPGPKGLPDPLIHVRILQFGMPAGGGFAPVEIGKTVLHHICPRRDQPPARAMRASVSAISATAMAISVFTVPGET